MSGLGNHWVVTITAALIVAARMDMHVSNHLHAQLAAFLPHKAELSTIELDDAMVETFWINIVVKKELSYRANSAFGAAKEKGTTLVNATGTAS